MLRPKCCWQLGFVQGFVPVIAEMLIHFRFGEKRALLGQENSKGHAEFFLEVAY